ncbi:peptidase m20 [Lucifera butyrica]|uniref:Peptidase m20 n=1 Tax=Lucifera butyrica TaxID=1351585 RepID=A0A498RAW6_9FIRM|nr:Zn-dependent hydrolase [Lucifera butyrica]VBB07273.1 peptidase m20 [Lucifera butyrica]
MEYDLKAGAKRIVANLRELAAMTSDKNGAQRVAWTPTWQKARDWFADKMKAEGAEVTVDKAGNSWAKIAGVSAEAILIGSHLDCVPNGGWLDGALGVAAGMEVMHRYGKQGTKPHKTLYLVNWADEEGGRFGRSLIGSSAVSGTLDIADIIHLKDNKGIPLVDALKTYDVDLGHILEAHTDFLTKKIVGYLELHIEQGPVLEEMKKSVACVYGITGCERHYIKFRGQAAHAGSFPTLMRQDAFLAAAQAALDFRKIALKYEGVCTVGKASVTPDVVTIVPETCTISLDQRSIDPDKLKAMFEEAQEVVERAVQEHHVTVSWEKIWRIEPTIFDPCLTRLCKEAVKEETGEDTAMYSGPLHDAAEMAKIVPSVMMFAMSSKGLSHCKQEDTPDADLETAASAFLRLAGKAVQSNL